MEGYYLVSTDGLNKDSLQFRLQVPKDFSVPEGELLGYEKKYKFRGMTSRNGTKKFFKSGTARGVLTVTIKNIRATFIK